MKTTLCIFLVAVASTMLVACAGGQPAEPSVNTQLNECVKIADRDERTRCIDAAHRSG